MSDLTAIQEASYRRADEALRSSWPQDQALRPEELDTFLDERRYGVLATTTPAGRAQARPVAFAVLGGAFWLATVRGGRLRNVEHNPWVSLVVADGEGVAHRAVSVDGPAMLHERPPAAVLNLWEARHGSRAMWAAAWLELRPERLFSHRAR